VTAGIDMTVHRRVLWQRPIKPDEGSSPVADLVTETKPPSNRVAVSGSGIGVREPLREGSFLSNFVLVGEKLHPPEATHWQRAITPQNGNYFCDISTNA